MSRSQAEILITAVVAVAACVAAFFGAPPAVTIVIGLVVFAAPGYLLGRLLFGPHIAGLERVAVVAGLIFAVPILGGLALNAAGVPLHRAAWLGVIAGVTLVCDALLLVRQRVAPPAPLSQNGERRRLSLRQAATFGIAGAIAISGLVVARVGAEMQRYPGYTQLSLIRPGKNAPAVDLSVANREGKAMRYRVVLARDNHTVTTWNLSLVNGQTWHRTSRYSSRYSISVNLFRLPGASKPYRHVVLNRDGHGYRD